MDWPEFPDPSLQGFIEERQAKALETYEIDPDLLVEHVRQEDSFRTGGYGTRQISELLQNAVDAVSAGGVTGAVEFRLADGALYCANEGREFDRDGVKAVTYAFLSTKRGDEIGRFGLGFKSVLGITDHPQVYSRSVAFEFNSPAAAELFAGVDTPGGRLPLLRIPTVVDARAAAAVDPNLAEMMSWATTVVKLPLTREGARLREELGEFKAESLLFFEGLDRLTISLQPGAGRAPTSRTFRREGRPDDGEVQIISPDGEAVRWLYAERQYVPTLDVAATLQTTALRESMTVSYAVRPEGRMSIGQLWAWFPLQDKTTASGLFNAPWQVTDDRTSLVPGSLLNKALLGVAADLFLDVVMRASSADDPAAHLDLFPARGRASEIRSNADEFLSDEIPARARHRAIVPDVAGELCAPPTFIGVPDVDQVAEPAQIMRIWQRAAPRTSMPHWSCFRTRQRAARLRSLLGGDDRGNRSRDASIAGWIAELTAGHDFEGLASALEILQQLRTSSPQVYSLAASARVIPLADGEVVRADATKSILLPRAGAETPDGVRTIESEVANRFRGVLKDLGFREVSTDEIAMALAGRAMDSWTEEEWEVLWRVIGEASPLAAEAALVEARRRGVKIRIRTQAGTMRIADEVNLDGAIARDIPSRQVDETAVPNVRLRRAAGAFSAVEPGRDLTRDALFAEYRDETVAAVLRRLRSERHKVEHVALPPMSTGAGPVDLLAEQLSEVDRVTWTRSLMNTMKTEEIEVRTPVGGRNDAEIRVWSFEAWAARKYGLLSTSQGVRRVSDGVSPALSKYAAFLPVVGEVVGITLPRTLQQVPPQLLQSFVEREDYAAPDPTVFVDLLEAHALHPDLPVPERIPAISQGTVALFSRMDVAVMTKAEHARYLTESEIPYIPAVGGAGVFTAKWGLQTSDEALQQTIEVAGRGETIPLADLHPSLVDRVTKPIGKLSLVRADTITRVLQSRSGTKRSPLPVIREDRTAVVDASLDDHHTLMAVSDAFELGLQPRDCTAVLDADLRMRQDELIARANAAPDDKTRLLLLVEADVLRMRFPRGFLGAVEGKRSSVLTDDEVAALFIDTYGNDAVYTVREDLQKRGIPVPSKWDGSAQAQQIVKSLGFATSFAGSRDIRPPNVTQVQGKTILNRLHDYQADLAWQIRSLVTETDDEGSARRGLLYLPTGAGKTRVTVEAVLTMMKDGLLSSPVLWIAQSQELCEQAIQSFAEVWRWMGDERPLDVSRFWSGYEVDQSDEELQIVVAIDKTLDSRLPESSYDWLRDAGMVVIDEAHAAGDSPTYTRVLRQLGLTSAQTDRPLLGLTATPFKGRNADVNRLFAARFGDNLLKSLPDEDPIGELRRRGVLSEVDHHVLGGVEIVPDAEARRMREVSKSMLDAIGQDLDRTQTVVDDIAEQVRAHRGDEGFPVLVFAASVASAHTIAALLGTEGVRASAVDGKMRTQQRRAVVQRFKDGEIDVLVNCDLLTQGFDAPKVRALYVARPTFSPNRYLQMVGRGLRGPKNGGTERCLVVNVADTFAQFGEDLAYNEFDYLWSET